MKSCEMCGSTITSLASRCADATLHRGHFHHRPGTFQIFRENDFPSDRVSDLAARRRRLFDYALRRSNRKSLTLESREVRWVQSQQFRHTMRQHQSYHSQVVNLDSSHCILFSQRPPNSRRGVRFCQNLDPRLDLSQTTGNLCGWKIEPASLPRRPRTNIPEFRHLLKAYDQLRGLAE